ncbi:hypothetical protein SNE40_011356 [Patella caerulea]|uniref:Rieske domain-containing protein n=1 Tax=Patella caerulea TaxID=87958 RepID=A0AAN8JNE0_PATCE
MEKILVCEISEVIATGRKQVTVNDRNIFIIYDNGEFFALDSYCYHAGGPLHIGEIEEYGGKKCITCPWHRYKICIANGEGLYESINPFDLSKPPEIKSKGVKQRIHRVTTENGKVYVELSTKDSVDSDNYNDKDSREKLQLV